MKKRAFVFLFLLFSTLALSAALHKESVGEISDANFPKDAEGRVYHLGLKKGKIANRILLVGDPSRAERIVSLFDHPDEVFTFSSNRGFSTYTGTKEGVPITVMSIGMGTAMMDFSVREIRAITEGPLKIIRLGSCGTPNPHIPISALVVAKYSYGIFTNYDAYHNSDASEKAFTVTEPIKADENLHQALLDALKNGATDIFPVYEGVDATADSFYGSQGRIDPQFDDRNAGLIDEIYANRPSTGSLQMETYNLYHLAKLSEYAQGEKIQVAACAIVLAQRHSNAFLPHDKKHVIELEAGNACLQALINCPEE